MEEEICLCHFLSCYPKLQAFSGQRYDSYSFSFRSLAVELSVCDWHYSKTKTQPTTEYLPFLTL